MNETPLFVTHWWGESYAKFAKSWVKNCIRFKLDYVIVNKSCHKSKNNQERTNSKAAFVLECIKKYKRPIVFIDVDMKIQKKPVELLNCSDVDFCAPNWNADSRTSEGPVRPDIFETVSQVFFINNTRPAIKLLKLWIESLKKTEYKRKADDRVLALVFYLQKASKWCRCKWLPVEYFYIPQYYSHLRLNKKAVIIHPHDLTSEEEAERMGADRNRIPKGYGRITRTLASPL